MPAIAAGFIFTRHDRSRLARAMCRRLQAVLLVAEGRPAGEVAALLKASRSWVTKTLARYCLRCRPGDLAEKPRRPSATRLRALGRSAHRGPGSRPAGFCYAASGWTAPLLAAHLRDLFGASAAVSVRTLRRRLHAAGLAARATSLPRSAPRPEKRALVRRLKARPARAVLLAEDETLRLLPPLRAAWARGQQALVPITARTLSARSLARSTWPRGTGCFCGGPARARPTSKRFCAACARSAIAGQPIWLLLDRATYTVALAARLDSPCSGCRVSARNAMDHLWRHLKKDLAANRQRPDIARSPPRPKRRLASPRSKPYAKPGCSQKIASKTCGRTSVPLRFLRRLGRRHARLAGARQRRELLRHAEQQRHQQQRQGLRAVGRPAALALLHGRAGARQRRVLFDSAQRQPVQLLQLFGRPSTTSTITASATSTSSTPTTARAASTSTISRAVASSTPVRRFRFLICTTSA